MSLPRTLSLNSEGELQTQVIEATSALRTTHTRIGYDQSASTRERLLKELRIHDLCAEVELEVHPNAGNFSIRLQSDTEEFVTLSFIDNGSRRELGVNTLTAPVAGAPGSPIHLHMFLDGSVLEIFANTTTAVTARVYRTPSGPIRVSLAGPADVKSLDVWQMKPISPDRLTGSLCS
jgi:beta-fructofuranosidase